MEPAKLHITEISQPPAVIMINIILIYFNYFQIQN